MKSDIVCSRHKYINLSGPLLNMRSKIQASKCVIITKILKMTGNKSNDLNITFKSLGNTYSLLTTTFPIINI